MKKILLICFTGLLLQTVFAFEPVKYTEMISWNFNVTKYTIGNNPVKQLQCIDEESATKDLCDQFALNYASCERAERYTATKKGWICRGDRMPINIELKNRKVDCEDLIDRPGYFVNGSCALFYSLEYTSNSFDHELAAKLIVASLLIGLLQFQLNNLSDLT